jgi:hypothetical protein
MSASPPAAPRLVHRTAHIRLRVTHQQTNRCYGLLRSAGDVWAWLLDTNRQRQQQGERPLAAYQALCRQLTSTGSFGELSVVGARSVLRRYADAWFQAAKRRKAGQQDAGFPRRKRALDSGRVAGVDLGIIHPYAVVTKDAGLLISGRALRAENYLHLEDQKARHAKAAKRAPKRGQRGSRRWKRNRVRLRRAEARHRRRVPAGPARGRQAGGRLRRAAPGWDLGDR